MVLSPLVALMNDQVRSQGAHSGLTVLKFVQVLALKRREIPCAALRGTPSDVSKVLREARSGKLKLVYTTPERIFRNHEVRLSGGC